MDALTITAMEPVKLDGDDTLDTIAGKIKACLKRSEDYRVTAGQLLAEARRRVEAREAGDVGWEAWCKANVERSYRDVQRLLAIANAPDPAVAAEAERAVNRVQKQASRTLGDSQSPPAKRRAPSPVDDYPEPSQKVVLAWVNTFRQWPTHTRHTAATLIGNIYDNGDPYEAKADGETPLEKAINTAQHAWWLSGLAMAQARGYTGAERQPFEKERDRHRAECAKQTARAKKLYAGEQPWEEWAPEQFGWTLRQITNRMRAPT